MKIDCPHWEDVGLRDAGRCALGKFQGTPSRGTCGVCLGITPTPPVAKRLLPAILTEEQKKRVRDHRAVCEGCEHAKGFTQLTVKCEGCGCVGVSLLNGRCPKSKWVDRLRSSP